MNGTGFERVPNGLATARFEYAQTMNVASLVIACVSLLVAVGCGVWAVHASRQAHRDATEALGVAKDSKGLAEEASTMARKAEVRAAEQVDIRWGGIWVRPGVYRYTNLGRDAAHDVHAAVDIGELHAETRSAYVAGGKSVDIEIPGAADAYREQERQRQSHDRRQQEESRRGPVILPPFMPDVVGLTEHVDWKTPAGNPGRHDDHFPLGELGPY